MLRTSFPVLVIFSTLLGDVTANDVCEACYRIGTGALIGIIVGDVAITILIAAATYYLTRRSLGKKGSTAKEKSKGEVVLTESPYQELQVSDLGVYSDLKPACR
ncbi:TYRO protein tyrosine kinase-binding protein-like [Mobula birostris]|uniref:TYRO protein tyrosine kinase-binding protein-like n=1 Tax=Mobula birostris TaxID=1983395 RepID=UPI003B28B8D1